MDSFEKKKKKNHPSHTPTRLPSQPPEFFLLDLDSL